MNILQENEDLQHLPLVDCYSSMILLGSVERNELIKIIAKQISREKRLQVAIQWQKEVQDIRIRQDDELKRRRPSHIVVSDASDVLRLHDVMENIMLSSTNWQDDGLKNRRPSRIEAAELGNVTRLHDAVDTVIISGSRKDAEISHAPEVTNPETITSNSSGYTILENVKESTKLLPESNSAISKTVGDDRTAHVPPQQIIFSLLSLQPYERVVDMSPLDQKHWEQSQLNESIDFDYEHIEIDPSPFQLVEKTPISKVHRLFTILSLRRAYVTQLGRLVGVVGLKELRSAIEDSNNGNFIVQCMAINSLPGSETQTQNSPNANDGHVGGDFVMTDVEKAY